MAAQQHLFGLVGPRGIIGRSTLVGMPALHRKPVRAHDVGPRRAASKAKYLISLFLGHLVREAGAPAPRIGVTVCCWTPAGKPAVEIRF